MTSATLPRSRTASGTTYLDEGHGEPLVLIHGVGMRLEAWTPQIAALSAMRRVIAVDMPGHGGSQRLVQGARLPDFVDWLGRFLDDLNLTRVALAGHSMGALIAGGAAATFADRIERVALLNGVYRRTAEARAAVMSRSLEIDRGHVDLAAPLSRWFSSSEIGGAPYALVRDWLASVDIAGYGTAYAAFAEGDAVYADRISGVACPCLFLTGEHDLNSTPDMSRQMAAAVRDGVAVIVPGHRHMVNLTAPQIVNAALAEWIERDGAA